MNSASYRYCQDVATWCAVQTQSPCADYVSCIPEVFVGHYSVISQGFKDRCRCLCPSHMNEYATTVQAVLLYVCFMCSQDLMNTCIMQEPPPGDMVDPMFGGGLVRIYSWHPVRQE